MNTGVPEIDAILKSISKKFKKDLTSQNYGNIIGASTGSSRLDAAMGIGGVPIGHVTEIFGWEASGKTSLALSIIALAQARRRLAGITNKRDLFIDLEHSMTESFITGFGIDMAQIIWLRPDNADEALQIAIDVPKSGLIDFVLFDSVDAAQSTRQLQRNIGEADVGGVSKEMNAALRQISKIAPQTETTYLFINQIKQNPGAFMKNPNVTSGGNALKYYSMLRLELMTKKPSPNLPNAFLMRIKFAKSKVAPPGASKDAMEIDFIYGKGFDAALDLFSWAKDIGVIRSAGQKVVVQWTEDTEEEAFNLTGGKATAMQMLNEDPALFNKLKEACIAKAKTGLIAIPLDDESEDE